MFGRGRIQIYYRKAGSIMGGGNWSDDLYQDRQAHNQATGTPAFAYHQQVSSTPYHDQKVHDLMNPKGVLRESRDSPAHPNSVAISVMFDVTGSMGEVPKTLQKELVKLMTLLLTKGYVVDPHILFGAIGDYNSDRAPLQVGQFESSVEMDEDLSRLWLEGNGGGQGHESYQDALYFFARHTSIDCFEKRGKKGYLFIIGDEMIYDRITKKEASEIFGDNIEGDIMTTDLLAEVREKYEVFFIIPKEASHGSDNRTRQQWVSLLGGENVLSLNKAEGVCESIALTIGLLEGSVDLNQGIDDLKSAGTAVGVVNQIATQLDPLAQRTALSKVGAGNLPIKVGTDSVARI